MSENLYDFSKRQDETTFDQLVRVSVDKINKLHKHDWTDIKEDFNFEHSSDNLRKYATGFKMMIDNGYVKGNVSGELPKYKEVTELKGDGTQTSDKLIRISEQDMKNPNSVLIAHGYDPKEFELVNSRSSMWNSSSDSTLYSSRITVKPKVCQFNMEKLVDKAISNIKPYYSASKVTNGKNLLEIFLTDMHFGVNDFDYYKETLDEVVELIECKAWDTIYIPFGSDLLHNNDFRGNTANSTPIEKVDMEKAWEDAFKFYHVIYTKSLENAVNVVSDYVCGNHDKDFTYGLIKTFSKLFTDIKWDTSPKNKKLFTWKDVAILCMHGDKGTSRISKTIYKEYGKLISDKKVVEIHTGDKHHTKTDDSHGVIFRILPTKASSDEWHTEQSFTGSMKAFHIFEYAEDKLKTIYHV